jgi:TonB family protein
MKNVTSLLMLITSVMTNAALAAETTAPNASRKSIADYWEEPRNAPERILGDTISIRPGSPHYSAALAETGAQGRVILLLDLSKDGQVKGARVHTSSRSDALDAAAIRKALTMSYQGRGAPPATASLKVDFRRDWADTLVAKSCGDFNVDVAWFRKAFPSNPETDMPAIAVLGNLVRLNYGSADRFIRTPILNAVPFAQCAVVPGCAASPEARLGEVFNRALQAHIDDPKSNEALCAFTRPTASQDEGLPRSLLQVDLDKPIWARTQYITPEMPAYPQQLVSAGVQGQVMVEATATKQGQISDIRVTNNQSEVAALADAAVAYARHLPLSQAARADAPETIVVVPIQLTSHTRQRGTEALGARR